MSKDGGPAFPEIDTYQEGERGDYWARVQSAGGMSLRDYFAAKAMQGLIASMPANADSTPLRRAMEKAGLNSAEELHARNAYLVADAMLEERKK